MTLEATTAVPDESSGDQRLAVLLAMAMFVLVVDTSLMNVSISAVVHDLDTTASGVQSAIGDDDAVSRFDDLSLDALRLRTSEKWVRYPPDVLPGHVAELDFPLAPPVAAALTEAIERSDLGYAAASRTKLPGSFSEFAARRWGWDVDPAAVVAVPDVMVGVAELLRLLTPAGAGVVVTTPVYPPFFSVIAEVGRTVVEVPLLEPGEDVRLPLEGIRDAFAAGARAMLLCNPHNPTGYVAREDELTELAAIVRAHDGLLLADEIHGPLVHPGVPYAPIGALQGVGDGASVALTSATKGWNLAGLKCGLAVAHSDRMREALEALPVDLHDRVGHFGVIASIAAYTEGDQWLDELRAYLAETHRQLPALLAEQLPGVGYHPARASYLAWLDCRELGLGDDPAAHFLERGRVSLVPGPTFGPPGRGFARLNVGTSWSLVEEAVGRMASSLA